MVGWDGRGGAPPAEAAVTQDGAPGEPGAQGRISVGAPPNYDRTNPLSPAFPAELRDAAASTFARAGGRGPVRGAGAGAEETYVLHPDTVRALQHPIIHDARSGHRYDHVISGAGALGAAGGAFTDQMGRRFQYGATAQQTGLWLENRCAYCHTHYGDVLVYGSGVLVVRCDRGECRRARRDRTTIFYGAVPAVLAGMEGVILDPRWTGPERV
jgi:hypothetical protein